MIKKHCLFFLFSFLFPVIIFAQHTGTHISTPDNIVSGVEPQPLLAQAVRLNEALSFIGSSLSSEDQKKLIALQHERLTPEIVNAVQNILDPYCLAIIDINPETRVKVLRGSAKAKLAQNGWVSFLVKVNNEAGVTAPLQVESPNAAAPLHVSTFEPHVKEKNILTPGQVANQFLEMQLYRNRPLLPNLSGLKLEYAVLQIYSKDAGQREAQIGFNIGQGTQDIGFRNTINILFNILPSVNVIFHVKDEDGSPAMASFLITDGIERILDDSINTLAKADFRLTAAQLEYRLNGSTKGYKVPAKLTGIYPLPSRRVAAYDEYPDFFFQPQVYRSDGEYVQLPSGKYNVTFTKGPEYIPQTVQMTIPSGVHSFGVTFKLKRWVNMAKLGWFSADHHVHAAGCSHYESPEEGVKPKDMWRQAMGEDLNVAAVLAWGPSWYHQKTFFTGHDDPLSTSTNIMRNDVEVSGFPSSHAGHIVLLRLKEDDYPGTTKIEEWPSWTLPVLTWAKSQNAVVGYAHSGWGLEPTQSTKDLPNYIPPKMDGIGANEYVVTVTQNVVDFYSAGDTPAPWELNMWYHSLNCGFTTRLSGETDFPCIFDERVGLARSYFKTDNNLNYDGYVAALKKGRCYVSDGSSHIIDFSVNGVEAGTNDSRVSLNGKETVKITAKVAANLSEQQDQAGAAIAQRALTEQPYWNLERARIGTTRKVRVELIVNGEPVDTTEIAADGNWKDVSFTYPVSNSSWMALRIYPSSHTNPVFVIVNDKPVHVRKSAEWCRQAVDQCWKMKQSNIRQEEHAAAEATYNKARNMYDKIIEESLH
ncbi:CehA/McbA family metallohydrolase [Segetibacter koreensis]|uniref:CehA/McbA family metallohydrolase n=1 Tax=Segetibacter koreensis TaxID=398037 RepID=UPI000382DC95|nr:CehA/McbA family metallohydrolase [Segetibacter koreensis]